MTIIFFHTTKVCQDKQRVAPAKPRTTHPSGGLDAEVPPKLRNATKTFTCSFVYPVYGDLAKTAQIRRELALCFASIRLSEQ